MMMMPYNLSPAHLAAAGALKMEDRKMEDQIWGEVRRWKMEDRKNGGLENGGPENAGPTILDRKMQDQIILLTFFMICDFLLVRHCGHMVLSCTVSEIRRLIG